ncbi:hypothetical protein QQ045_002729 [Rhodiola kirilowii]
MGNSIDFLLAIFLSVTVRHFSYVHADIAKSMFINWGGPNASIIGDDLQLVLDQDSGSGAQSKKSFLFGSIEMLIKFVPGNSAGTVTAYYLSSNGTAHDEIDFEFLGNVSGQPYVLHTNIFTQGKGDREQQFYPWFDPTADFHKYAIHWNPTQVVWYVDRTPIRVFRNYENHQIAYPNKQGMSVYTSLWNADNWATRGGLDKFDWTNAPFIARFRKFNPKVCTWTGDSSILQCAAVTHANWWTAAVYKKLSSSQMKRMQRIRSTNMIYDYCNDTNRFNGVMPPECSLPQF